MIYSSIIPDMMKASNCTARWNKQDTKQEDKVWKNRYMGKYKFVTAQHISESYKLVTVIAFRESQPRGLRGRIHSSLPFHICWILYHGVYYLANSLNLVKKKKRRKKKSCSKTSMDYCHKVALKMQKSYELIPTQSYLRHFAWLWLFQWIVFTN